MSRDLNMEQIPPRPPPPPPPPKVATPPQQLPHPNAFKVVLEDQLSCQECTPFYLAPPGVDPYFFHAHLILNQPDPPKHERFSDLVHLEPLINYGLVTSQNYGTLEVMLKAIQHALAKRRYHHTRPFDPFQTGS
ncbi:uncharacterized protein LOC101855731 [Aplysia californica]|uniref:Uncharacterized protein LOC101855731 n=1 Tax=Aplysia californica TaxID=6500 RepID=A0ABM0JRU6_APLCA|nr:uncharacterized protein LOC101855731 [Aplysia californica]